MPVNNSDILFTFPFFICYNVLVLFYTTLFLFLFSKLREFHTFFPGALLFFENVIIQKNKVYISSYTTKIQPVLSYVMLCIPYFFIIICFIKFLRLNIYAKATNIDAIKFPVP